MCVDALSKVSVVMPVYNRADLVLPNLEALPAEVELVVVDDASTEPVADLVAARVPRARLLRNERNLGFAATANHGLHSCTRPVRVVLNSDARPRAGALAALARAFDDPAVGIAGPRLVFPDGSHQTSAAAFPTAMSFFTGSFLLNEVYRALRPNGRFRYELGMARRDHDVDRDVDWVHGTCIAVRDECLQDCTGFDEGYRFLLEEVDLCWRARRAGWRVRYVADAVVEHLGGGSEGDPTVRARLALRSEARFMARAYGRRVLWRWRLARVLGGLVKALLLTPVAVVSRRARTRWRWQLAALRSAVGRDWMQGLDAE